VIPDCCGECIIINYNGFIPKKTQSVFGFALCDMWYYVEHAEVASEEQKVFERAKSIGTSIFANDYIKIAFPQYTEIKNKMNSFKVKSDKYEAYGVLVQDLGQVARKCLDADNKTYAKTLARAAVKYIVDKSVSQAVEENKGDA
jgi:hypothetical protein